ncbi:hypothetical protein EYF80_050002 [Liparis tanakae]|uniref:Uncharacterized protein n=1 Tax=Liparis tanakae TaxID=230148 RepID=A0A4Z2FFV4_9TELE|nr:hypothetical protein EYF80_050002 [Liparis tanakae]
MLNILRCFEKKSLTNNPHHALRVGAVHSPLARGPSDQYRMSSVSGYEYHYEPHHNLHPSLHLSVLRQHS